MLLNFQAVKRIVHLPKTFAQENDVEHSYALAMTAWFLAPYFPELNRDKLIRFALAHDLVEVHAGDTYIYGKQTDLDSKTAREAAALEKLQNEWPDFPELTDTIHDYEDRASEEAKFIYALDKIMPVMLIFIAEGHSWHKENVSLEQLHTHKQAKVSLSPAIQAYYNQLYALLQQHTHYFPPRSRD